MKTQRIDAALLLEADFTLVLPSTWRKRWLYDFRNLTLIMQHIHSWRHGYIGADDPTPYEVDLEAIRSRAELLGTLGHVSRKIWALKDAAVTAGLVDALDCLFGLEFLQDTFDPRSVMEKRGYPVKDEPPVIRCVRSPCGRQLVFKCGYCGSLHYHGSGGAQSPIGAGDGHRVSHCNSPVYQGLGYTLKEIPTPRKEVLKILKIRM